jgi:uncharacterized protein
MIHVAYNKQNSDTLWLHLYDFNGWVEQRRTVHTRNLVAHPEKVEPSVRNDIENMATSALSGVIAKADSVVLAAGGYTEDGTWGWGDITHRFDLKRKAFAEAA